MIKNSTRTEETIEIEGLYLDEYDEIVKPDVLFLIPNYFIQYWLHRLGPTLSWIVVSLQQACWRAEGNNCTIAQSTIAKEVGIERHTISRVIKDNQWSHWYIPQVEDQPGSTDKQGIYYPAPRKYQVYRLPPLTPDHLAGLYIHFQKQCQAVNSTNIEQAINELLNISGKEALALLEVYAQENDYQPQSPLSVGEVITSATGFEVEKLPSSQAKELKKKISSLQSHLTNIGKTICRQYFRLTWVPQLGPSMAWFVTILRSRCYYNLSKDEVRDVCTWQKKEIVETLGQSRNSLRNLLSNKYTGLFFQIIDQRRHKLTLRVAMTSEPLLTDTPEAFWSRQPTNAQKSTMTPFENAQKSTMTLPQNAQKSTMTPLGNAQKSTMTSHECTKIYHDPALNAQKCSIYKYFKKQVLIVVEKNEIDSEQNNTLSPEHQVQGLLSAVGVSGTGLSKLLERQPPLDVLNVRATVLYAEANNLGPGYVFRHLDEEARVDERFLVFAALDDQVLALFFEAVGEIRINGTQFPYIQTAIPADRVELFAQFAEAFTGVEPATIIATLRHKGSMVSEVDLAPAEKNELDELWNRILGQLQLQMTRSTFDTWVKDTRLVFRDGPKFTVAVKNGYAKDWLENRLFNTIRRTVTELVDGQEGLEIELEFVVAS